MAEVFKRWLSAQDWVPASGHISTMTALVCDTLLVLLLSTLGIFFSSTIFSMFRSWTLRRRGASPLPPGLMGMPFLGEIFSFRQDARSFAESRHAKYGPIFKSNLAGNVVFLQAPAGNKFLFANESKLVELSWQYTVTKLLGKESMGMKVGEAHRRTRKYITPLLSPSALMQYMPRVEQKVRNHLAEYWQPPVGMRVGTHNEQEQGKEFQLVLYDTMNKIAFCVIADLVLSLNSSDPDTEKLRLLFELWSDGISVAPIYLPGTTYYRAMRARAEILSTLGKLMAKRRVELREGKATPTQDFLSYFLTQPDCWGEVISDVEIKDSLLHFLIGGYSTTSHVLTLTLRSIALHPHIYMLLKKEHDSIAERKREGETLTPEDLAAMKYTWCVLQESMRINAPVLGGYRKATNDFEYGGFTIPKGWKMFWTTATHMDPRFFKEPTKFDPSRFGEASKHDILPHVYAPFGGGQRICPGNNFAKMEMLIYMHWVIQNYSFRLVYPDEPVVHTSFAGQKSGTLMKICKLT